MVLLATSVIQSGNLIRPRVVTICTYGQRPAKHVLKRLSAAADTAELQNVADRSASADGCAPQPQQQQRLIDWIRQHGGYVHPSLIITDHAPCGCRGVVACQDIPMPLQSNQHSQEYSDMPSSEELNASIRADESHAIASQLSAACAPHLVPLMAVPEQLYMTTDDAVQILTKVLLHKPHYTGTNSSLSGSSHGIFSRIMHQLSQLQQKTLNPRQQLAESLTRLQPPLLLALLLAHERNKGLASKWHPYIAALPAEPPCGWFPSLQCQPGHSHCQQKLLQHRVIRPETVAAAASAVKSKCTAAAKSFGPLLDVTVDDVVWAFGQVVSRAYGSGSDVGLAPLIDMVNHEQGAPIPQLLAVPAAVAAPPAHEQLSLAVGQQGVTDDRYLNRVQGSLNQLHDSAPSQLLWAVCVAPRHKPQNKQRQPVMIAGQELYVSYIASCDAATAFLNFGFVPPEHLS